MKIFSHSSLRVALLAGTATAAAILVIGLSFARSADTERILLHADSTAYSSIDALNDKADSIIVGEVVSLTDRLEDRGGDPAIDPASGEPIPGIPMAVYKVLVSEDLRRTPTAQTGNVLLVATLDPELTRSDEVPLEAGQEVLLFLLRRTEKEAPGFAGYAEFFVPLSGSNGVFDVIGSDVKARSPIVRSIEAAPVTGAVDLDVAAEVFRLSDVRSALASTNT
jgi:hypothetical protein